MNEYGEEEDDHKSLSGFQNVEPNVGGLISLTKKSKAALLRRSDWLPTRIQIREKGFKELY
jgi:hypothetical protein